MTTVHSDLDYDVVIPSHGRNLSLLSQAIDSVAGQTLPPSRIIVVVDGDRQAAAWLTQTRSDVDVILHAVARGQAAARQSGIEAATAEWVAFLDDDDLWSPRKQERMADYLRSHPECNAVRSGFWMFSPDSTSSGLFGQVPEVHGDGLPELEARAANARPRNDLSYLDIEGRSLALMLERNRGVISTSVVRRSVLVAIPPVPEGTRPGDDFLLFCHVAAVTEWHLVRERLAYYRLHPGQDTRRPDVSTARGALDARIAAWRHHGASNTLPLSAYGEVYSAEFREAIWHLLKRGHLGEAIQLYRRCLVLLPLRRHRIAAAVPDPAVYHVGRLRSRLRAPSSAPRPNPAPSW